VKRVVGIEVEPRHEPEGGLWPFSLGDSDRAVEGDDRRGSETKEVVVQRYDLGPVGGREGGRVCVDRLDRGLDLEWARAIPTEAGPDQVLALLDNGRIPA
jgi:hypothetical protein